MTHATDTDLIKRLRRAEGHLSGVVKMASEGRDCLILVQQLQAVIKALEKSKKLLIHDHLDHHLVDMADPQSPEKMRMLDEFREITKYL